MSYPTALDLDTFARTLLGEVALEPLAGKIAAAWAIRNRVEADIHGDGKPDWWGEGYRAVCLAPWQFSCWNQSDPNRTRIMAASYDNDPALMDCLGVATAVAFNFVPDPTGGATHYYNPRIVKAPSWAGLFQPRGKIGAHLYFHDP